MPPPDPWAAIRKLTPARIALGHAGGSLPTSAHLAFQLAHAQARDAVHQPLDVSRLASDVERAGLAVLTVRSAALDRVAFLQRPDLGRRLEPASRTRLEATRGNAVPDALFVLGDGLSSLALQRHAVPLLSALVPRLRGDEWTVAPVVVAEQARVALGDEIGALLGARIVAMLIGERPGLSSPDSLGVYLTYAPAVGRKDADRNCISNIRPDGLTYERAADRLHFLMAEACRRKLTGIGLKDDSGRFLPS